VSSVRGGVDDAECGGGGVIPSPLFWRKRSFVKEFEMDVKQWRCKAGHVLGQIMKNGSDVPQLLVLRHAIDAEA